MLIYIKILRNILLLLFIIGLIGVVILHFHGILHYLDFETTFLLLKNGINIFKLQTNDFGVNYIDPCSLELLILELKGELN
uniref:Orf79 n=1 Tax=Phytophthora sojae TaxID=67593 RepID=A4ZH73_PHYSO|nr:orf79 [Phytophthora sojae]ABG54042.1 orf79 [Phytophthora sojae]